MPKHPPRPVPQIEGVNHPHEVFDVQIREDLEHACFDVRKLARIGVAATMTEANIKLTPEDFEALIRAMGTIAARALLHDEELTE